MTLSRDRVRRKVKSKIAYYDQKTPNRLLGLKHGVTQKLALDRYKPGRLPGRLGQGTREEADR